MKKRRPAPPARRRGPPKLYPERIVLPLAGGTCARVWGLLKQGENRVGFIRDAIEREIERRTSGPGR
jgi:hypothetical protein